MSETQTHYRARRLNYGNSPSWNEWATQPAQKRALGTQLLLEMLYAALFNDVTINESCDGPDTSFLHAFSRCRSLLYFGIMAYR